MPSFFEEVADENAVREMIRRGVSHEDISQYYQNIFPGRRGLSQRSVRRYCRVQNISRINDNELIGYVENLVSLYGHSYGRRLMQGSIRSMLGISSGAISQRRIARALHIVAPREYHARARDLLIRTNPVPYYAPYFGYKAHFDQNEKIAMYRNSSNLVRPLINADKLFWQSGTNSFPLKISADAFSPISDFPLI